MGGINILCKSKIKYLKIVFKITIFLFFIYFYLYIKFRKIKVGIIGLEHSQNIGNNLLKYAIYIKLIELGFEPYIVGMKFLNDSFSFIQNNTNLRLINNSFSEIKKNDYDILMVNSDQTWRKWNEKYFYDIAFLKFAYNWDKPKFVYGASLGTNNWEYNKEDEKISKNLLKDFTGISVREKGAITLIENNLGIKPIFVLDPTLLIDKKYYLNLIADYNNKIDNCKNNIFVYSILNLIEIKRLTKRLSMTFHYKINWVTPYSQNQIKKFIYGVNNSQAIITDSYHGTLFSIIFNKPFIAFVYDKSGNDRFNTLKELFNLENRIFNLNTNPDVSLLETPLIINRTKLNLLKKKSIIFLSKNLNKAYKKLFNLN